MDADPAGATRGSLAGFLQVLALRGFKLRFIAVWMLLLTRCFNAAVRGTCGASGDMLETVNERQAFAKTRNGLCFLP